MEVIIKKSSLIVPATETPTHRLWLSPLDLLMMRSKHSAFVYFYKSNNNSLNSFQPQVLKEALSNVLVPFYPAAGRFGRDDSGRIELICNAEGALFVEAEASILLDDLDYFAPNANFDQLFPFIDYSKGISSFPLVLIKATRFECGGMSLAVRTHHSMVDGPSAIHFLASWCNMARGTPINNPPFLDRTIMKSLMPHAPSFHHIEYFDPHPSLNNPILPPNATSTTICVLRIGSRDQLEKLKALSNQNGKRYTSYCILAAHLWRSVTKARDLPNEQVTKLALPIDGRPKLTNPSLPQGYFGNVAFLASAFSKAGDLLSEPFANTVEKIHVALAKYDGTYMKSSLACLENLLNNQASHLYKEGQYDSPNLVITKLSRLPLHHMDFGLGAPIFMGRAISFEGQNHMLPPLVDDPNGDYSFTLITSLATPHMKLFKKLVYENPVL